MSDGGGEDAVRREEVDGRGSFFIDREGKRPAEMTYTRSNASLVIIDHTRVDPDLSGQGVGRRLLDAAVSWARETDTKMIPLCPFARAQFERDPGIRDVLSGGKR